MRLFYFILLLLFVGALVAFALQNRDVVPIKFMEWGDSYPLPALLGAAYVLGMFSGWTVVGMIRRSLRRVTERN
jgi:lipopolysaccharide assembly protein A